MYTHVTVKLRYDAAPAFFEVMARIAQLVIENCGWELREALIQVDGRLSTVRHIWKLRDMNHYLEGAGFLQAHPEFPAIAARMGELVVEEEIAFAVPTPYAPAAKG